jgi:hypothetical protein
MGFTFPEDCKVTLLYQGAANAVDCDIISLKNAHKCWLLITHTGASDTDLVLTLNEATDVAGGTSAAIAIACPIWRNMTLGTANDLLVRTTDAYAYTIDTTESADRQQMIVWEIDPTIFSDGYDCLKVTDSGGNASNVCSILAITDPRQKQDPLLSNIVD